MASHNNLGKAGEAQARLYLEARGYEVLAQNWRCKKAEVDLIAFKEGCMVFVEVKTRTRLHYGSPESFVDPIKQQLLAEASEEFLYLKNYTGEIRFDIIAITYHDNQFEIKHIKDAFWPE